MRTQSHSSGFTLDKLNGLPMVRTPSAGPVYQPNLYRPYPYYAYPSYSSSSAYSYPHPYGLGGYYPPRGGGYSGWGFWWGWW